MFIKYEFSVSDLGLTPTSEHYAREYPLVFDYGRVRVELRPPDEDEQAAGHDSWTTLGESVSEFEPPKRVGWLEPLAEAVAAKIAERERWVTIDGLCTWLGCSMSTTCARRVYRPASPSPAPNH